MRYGEVGYNLEIDLATGNIERVETDPGKLVLGSAERSNRKRQQSKSVS